MPFAYLRSEAQGGRMGSRLLAVVAEGNRGRVYLAPTDAQAQAALQARPDWIPDADLPQRALGFRVQEYGMRQWHELFTHRQLVALTTFSDLVAEAQDEIAKDALRAGLSSEGGGLAGEGRASAPMPKRTRKCSGMRLAASMDSDTLRLAAGGTGAQAYADAVATYLGLCVSRQANRSSNLCFWHTGRETVEQVFARQALPMVWDFCEANPFSS